MAIDLDYIQNLAGSHEGVDVEFKETTGQLDRGMETLCGMLNGAALTDHCTGWSASLTDSEFLLSRSTK